MKTTHQLPAVLLALIGCFTALSCSKDNGGEPLPEEPETVTDIDGNEYKTVKIGDQVWMAENLKVTKYNDGTAIPEVETQVLGKGGWTNLTTGAWCYYDNDQFHDAGYGKLYNWHAVNTKKLAPEGWHVPSQAEWEVLLGHLGGAEAAYNKLRATTTWVTPGDADNSSGFAAVAAGERKSGNAMGFQKKGELAAFWTSSVNPSIDKNAKAFTLVDNLPAPSLGSQIVTYGLSVRCVKN